MLKAIRIISFVYIATPKIFRNTLSPLFISQEILLLLFLEISEKFWQRVLSQDYKNIFFSVIENNQVCSKFHLHDSVHKVIKLFPKQLIKIHAHFEKPCTKLKKCKFKIESTKIKIGKAEINLKTSQFYIWILIWFYKFLNFNFRFSNLTFIFKFHWDFTPQASASLTLIQWKHK